MKRLTMHCPCKVNLTLNITGVLPNGYHEMEMLMQAVDLCDIVTLTVGEGDGLRLRCSDPALPENDPENIAYRSAKALLADAGVQVAVEILIEKHIPMQAGLGGGSADGAGVLVGLNTLLGLGYSTADLCRIGAAIGADIPFCIVGGTALVTGFGEQVTPAAPLPDCFLLLGKPAAGVPTARCFAAYDSAAHEMLPISCPMLQALEASDLSAVAAQMHNALAPYTGIPEVEEIRRAMLGAGALGSVMSGSGSAVVGLFREEAAALHCAAALQAMGHFTALTRPLRHGPYSVQDRQKL